jgi:hypothetical protein
MSSAPYQPLSSNDYDEERSSTSPKYIQEHIQLAQDQRFNPPTPSWWKRALLILFIISMFWLYFSLRVSMQKAAEPKFIHTQRCVHRDFSLFVFRLYFLYLEDIQRNTSIVRRPALSFMRNSRMVGHKCGARLLPFDLSSFLTTATFHVDYVALNVVRYSHTCSLQIVTIAFP